MENVSNIVTADEAKQEVLQTARERAMQVKDTVTEETSRVVESIKTAAAEQVERGKHELADSLKSVDEALRKTSSQLENSSLAPAVEKFAGALGQAHDFIEHHRIEDLGPALRRLSLQHPAIFYAGIFAAGFAAGRFLSSTENRPIEPPNLDINLLDETPAGFEEPTQISQLVSHHGSY